MKDEIRELQIQTSLAFIELKKLNRMEKFRTKSARDSLVAAKSSVDSKHLHLQNLLYEVMHLKKEVIKCLQFKYNFFISMQKNLWKSSLYHLSKWNEIT